jgi:hypothetical protein
VRVDGGKHADRLAADDGVADHDTGRDRLVGRPEGTVADDHDPPAGDDPDEGDDAVSDREHWLAD